MTPMQQHILKHASQIGRLYSIPNDGNMRRSLLALQRQGRVVIRNDRQANWSFRRVS